MCSFYNDGVLQLKTEFLNNKINGIIEIYEDGIIRTVLDVESNNIKQLKYYDKFGIINHSYDLECSDYYDVKGNTNSFEHYGEALPYGVCFKPTQSLLQKWLRKVHKIHIQIQVLGQFVDGENKFYCQVIEFGKNKWVSKYVSKKLVYTYEEALEKGLQEALKLIKNK